ncbi:hypothetical protein ACRAWC_26385 [Leifsonia sp. L25]|uniref:hypothetical protein n=1 Tax=Actinomycetes TaxID=1760 RepID=UPI003D68F963
MDAAKRAAWIVAAEGWVVVERWGPGDARGVEDGVPSGRTAARDAAAVRDAVSLVVAGGELRGRAVLTVATQVGMAWGRVASSHLPRSLSPPDDRRGRRSRVVVRLREHPSGGSVDDLITADRGLTAGEAVTVLAAVARGLSDLHEARLGGVGLGPEDIALRDDGCPVMTAIDRLRELDQQTMAEDVAAFAELAGTLCEAVTDERGDAVLAAATDRRHRSWGDVVAGVLRAADPTAVRAVVSGAPDAVGTHARGDPDADGVLAAGRRRGGGTATRGHDVLGVLERALDLMGDRPVARGLAVARGWIVARPKLVAVACSPLVAVTVLLMVVPGQDGAS